MQARTQDLRQDARLAEFFRHLLRSHANYAQGFRGPNIAVLGSCLPAVADRRTSMQPTAVRAELLRQHADLRRLIGEVDSMAEQASKGGALGDRLQAAVKRLGDALERHNSFEEQWLRTIDAKVDGPTRAELDVLLDAHAREHEELHATVLGIAQTPVKFAGVDVKVLLKGLLEHMAREEVSLLVADEMT
jgi:hypothetical protein